MCASVPLCCPDVLMALQGRRATVAWLRAQPGAPRLPACLQDRQRIEYVLAKGDEERQEKRQARQGAHAGQGGSGGAPQKQLQALGQVGGIEAPGQAQRFHAGSR